MNNKHIDFIKELYNDYILGFLDDSDIQAVVMAYCLNNKLTWQGLNDDFDKLMNYFIELNKQ